MKIVGASFAGKRCFAKDGMLRFQNFDTNTSPPHSATYNCFAWPSQCRDILTCLKWGRWTSESKGLPDMIVQAAIRRISSSPTMLR